MANSDYTYDNIMKNGNGIFTKDSTFSASVRRMQTKLNRLGFDCGTANGIFDNNTATQLGAFQSANGLAYTCTGNMATLKKLDELSPDSAVENYGRELTHSELTNGYSNFNISLVESLARAIYGEDTQYSEGQAAVAKELYNRKNSPRDFDSLNSTNTWKGIVFSPSQYAVITGSSNDTLNARHPNQYSTSWANCVALAQALINGSKPSSTLSNQCYHLSKNSSYPSTSVASTRIQIPAGSGNKFFDYQTTL